MSLRRISAALALLLCLVALASGVPSRTQANICPGEGGDDSLACPLVTNAAGNSTIIAWCSVYLGTFSTTAATFSGGGLTWNNVINHGKNDAGESTNRMYMAWARHAAGGALTVTCDPPGTSNYITLSITEVADIASSTPVDQTATGADPSGTTSTAATGTTGTTTQASEYLTAAVTNGTGAVGFAPDSPLIEVNEEEDYTLYSPLGVGDRILSSTGAYSASWTLGNNASWAAALATLKEDLGGGISVRVLMGVIE